MGRFRYNLWPQFLHEIGSDRVDRLGHGATDGHSFVGEFIVCITRPICWLTWNTDLHRLVDHGITGTIAVFNCGRIHKGLESRARLTLALFDMVIFEMLVVDSSHPRFDMTRVGIHRHEAGLEMLFVMPQGVHSTHQSVQLAMFP